MLTANRDYLISSFPIGIYVIYFPSLLVLARYSEQEHTCLVPDLRGKAFTLSPLGTMLAIDIVGALYQVE